MLLAREVREMGCATLLLKDAEGRTNERAKPAMQAMETAVETVASFISVAIGVIERKWLRMDPRKGGAGNATVRKFSLPLEFWFYFVVQGVPLTLQLATPERVA